MSLLGSVQMPSPPLGTLNCGGGGFVDVYSSCYLCIHRTKTVPFVVSTVSQRPQLESELVPHPQPQAGLELSPGDPGLPEILLRGLGGYARQGQDIQGLILLWLTVAGGWSARLWCANPGRKTSVYGWEPHGHWPKTTRMLFLPHLVSVLTPFGCG